MEISKKTEGGQVVFTLNGRLDSLSSADLQDILIPAIDECARVVLDFGGVAYVSSAGLRVILMAKKVANGRRTEFSIRNMTEEVMKVFEMTGFSEMLELQPMT